MTNANKACPECTAVGGDRTLNHLFLMQDGSTWYCRKCQYREGTTIKYNNNKELTDNTMLVSDIMKYPILPVKGRKLTIASSTLYNVRGSVNVETGKVDTYYYPITSKGKLIGYKVKPLADKTMKTVGKVAGSALDFFGQHSACAKSSTKRLIITEGEEDALAAHQMLSTGFNKIEYSVVSLPLGAGNLQCLEHNKEFLDRFKEIIICTDMDEAGKKASAAISALYPEKAKIMVFDEKDACDMLAAGKEKLFVSAYFDAKVHAPEGFVSVEDVFEEATAMPVRGKDWPWPSLSQLTYGRRLGEGTYFGAGVKVGKSEAVNQIIHHITQVEKGKVAVFKLEEKPAMTVRKIAGKIKHKQFHVPDGDFTHDELVEGVASVVGTVVLYDSYMATSWDSIRTAIRHAVLVEGCKDVIIDPLTALTIGMNSADANVELERIAGEIAGMSKDLGFHYMFFCHLKAPNNGGKPHEEGGKVRSNQFTGSRAMMRACYYMIGIERDKTCEEEVQRNTSTFVLLEDRAFGNYGKFDVFYNRTTGDYLEITNDYEQSKRSDQWSGGYT